MDEKNMELLEVFRMFHKLNFSVLLQNMTQSEFVTMKQIQSCSREDPRGRAGISDIVKNMKSLPSAVSRTLKSLEEKEWICRTLDKSNRRNTYVELTEEGAKEIQAATGHVAAFMNRILQQVDPEDMEKLTKFLRELYEIFRDGLEDAKHSG